MNTLTILSGATPGAAATIPVGAGVAAPDVARTPDDARSSGEREARNKLPDINFWQALLRHFGGRAQ